MNSACAYCGSTKRLLKDHFIPKAITKKDIYLITACSGCNLSKSNRHPKIWYFHHFGFASQWDLILASVGLTDEEIDNLMSASGMLGSLLYKLPALMERKGVDQKTVAAATGLSPTTVGKLYRSHFDRIDNHTVVALCKYFGIRKLDDLIELVWEAEDEPKKEKPPRRPLSSA